VVVLYKDLSPLFDEFQIKEPLAKEDVIRLIDFCEDGERYDIAYSLATKYPSIACWVTFAMAVHVESDLRSPLESLRQAAGLWSLKKSKQNKINEMLEDLRSRSVSCLLERTKKKGWLLEPASNGFMVTEFYPSDWSYKTSQYDSHSLFKHGVNGIIPIDSVLVSNEQALLIKRRVEASSQTQAMEIS